MSDLLVDTGFQAIGCSTCRRSPDAAGARCERSPGWKTLADGVAPRRCSGGHFADVSVPACVHIGRSVGRLKTIAAYRHGLDLRPFARRREVTGRGARWFCARRPADRRDPAEFSQWTAVDTRLAVAGPQWIRRSGRDAAARSTIPLSSAVLDAVADWHAGCAVALATRITGRPPIWRTVLPARVFRRGPGAETLRPRGNECAGRSDGNWRRSASCCNSSDAFGLPERITSACTAFPPGAFWCARTPGSTATR